MKVFDAPTFVWAHRQSNDADDSDAVSMVLLQPRSFRPHNATHLRSMTPEMVVQLHSNDSFVRQLVEIALGEGDRSEDDVFVPTWELEHSGRWSAADATRETSGLRLLARSYGYPMQRLDRILSGWQEAGGADTSALTAIPQDPRYLNLRNGRVWISEKPEALPNGQVYGIACDDPEYLRRALAEPMVTEEIRCRSYGSYLHPRVPLRILRELEVPWPSQEDRRRSLDELRQAFDGASSVRSLVDDLQDKLEEIEGRIEQDAHEPIRLWEADQFWNEFARMQGSLAELLRPLAPCPGFPKQAYRLPPAPIALLRRRIENEPNATKKVQLLTEMTEVLLKYDLAVLLASLRRLDENALPSLLNGIAKNKEVEKVTLGRWREVQRNAREELRRRVQRDGPPDGLEVLYEALTAVQPKELTPLDELIQCRNDVHQPPQSERHDERICLHLEQQHKLLRSALGYIEQHMLVFIESSVRERHGMTLRFRKLVHDNESFALETLPVKRGGAWDRVNDKEAYLLCSQSAELISLSPWLYVSPPDTLPRHVIWLFDGVDAKSVIYKSPQSSDNPWKCADHGLLSDTKRLVGI